MKTYRVFFLAIFMLSCASLCMASTYYVSKTGNDETGDGSSGTPWATIGKCATTLVAGESCIVHSGTYEETVTPLNSGSSESGHIVYSVKTGDSAVVRGFNLTDKNYIKVIGFEVTHTGGDNTHSIYMQSSDHVQILNNYIHHTDEDTASGIRCSYSYPCTNLIIRGNRIEYPGCATGDIGKCTGLAGIYVSGTNHLIEYNSISHVEDYIETGSAGSNHVIVRNNYLGACGADCIDFPDYSGCSASYHHIDGLQVNGISSPFIFERNYMTDNAVSSAHGIIYQAAHDHSISRENLFVRSGVAVLWGTSTNNYWYNNTIVDGNYHKAINGYPEANYTLSISDNSTNNVALNNLYYKSNTNTGTNLYELESGSTITKDYDCSYQSGDPTEDHDVIGDPKFTAYSSDDFSIASDSACKGISSSLTTINNENGSGTAFIVSDAKVLVGGWSVLDASDSDIGDLVTVGNNTATKVIGINYDNNTITVADSISWSNGDNVRLSHQAASVDAGAYPYRAGGYALAGTYVKTGGTVTITPSDNDLVRFVEVWEDGVLIGTDSATPYSIVGIGSGTLSVKMYSMFASKTPIVLATDATPGQVTGSFGGNLR